MKSTKSRGKSWRLYGLVSILLVFGLVLTAYTANGQDLINAAKNGNIAGVKALLAKGADVNAKANNGGTALIAASEHGHLEVVKALLAKGADVNAENNGDRKSTRLNSSHIPLSRMPSSA